MWKEAPEFIGDRFQEAGCSVGGPGKEVKGSLTRVSSEDLSKSVCTDRKTE